MIPYGRQSIDQSDIDAVVEVLQSNYLTTGPKVSEFENALKAYCGFEFCVGYNSATSALHCACLALGVNSQSLVWVPTMSFVATANCAEYCGARTDFIDIDITTGQMDLALLESRLVVAEQSGQALPDVVICVHYAGHYCDMVTLSALAVRFGFKIIEDASHALGAEQPDAWQVADRGDIIVYSFHPVKMITSAEGGAALTNDADLARRIRLFGNHGITKNPDEFVHQGRNEPWYYEQQLLGFNYRINDVQAALGLSQLQRLPEFLQKRRAIAECYRSELSGCSIDIVDQQHNGDSSYHLFPILVNSDKAEEVFNTLHRHKIFVQKHYIPIPAQPYFQQKYAIASNLYEQAMQFCQRVISLPVYMELTDVDQRLVISVLKNSL